MCVSARTISASPLLLVLRGWGWALCKPAMVRTAVGAEHKWHTVCMCAGGGGGWVWCPPTEGVPHCGLYMQ